MSIQKVNFKSFDEFFDYLPFDQAEIVSSLREIIKEADPDIQEKLSYNVPFYAKQQSICFIWPSAVRWGGITQGVALGFIRGLEMQKSFPLLQMEGRKQIARLIILKVDDIDHLIIQSMIYEALYLDDQN